ncbi:uncharacterized protein FFMR_03515 [Fusarium fujikuroi]
MQGPP